MNKSTAYFNRKTPVSSAVLAFFDSSHHPVSVKHILDYLNSKRLFPNKTTVYRIIESWKESEVTWDEQRDDVNWSDEGAAGRAPTRPRRLADSR